MELIHRFNDFDNAWDLCIEEDIAYVLDEENGLFVIDVSNLEEPTQISRTRLPETSKKMAVSNEYCYCGYRGGVTILNISNPEDVEIVGTVPVPRHVSSLTAVFPYLLVGVSSGYNQDSYFDAWDVSDPANPARTGRWYGPVYDAVYQNELLYTASGHYIHILDISDALSIDDLEPNQPITSTLITAYPNPFNSQTRLSYTLTTPEKVSVSVVSLDGRIIKEHNIGALNEGEHSLTLDASGWATGIYLARMKAGYVTMTAKLVCLK